MSPTTIGIIGILIMLAVFMTKMPVAYVMTLVGFIGFGTLISFPAALALLPRNFYDSFSSYELTTIPLFVLMGQLAFNGGISRKLYNTAYSFMGNIKGGTGHGNGIHLYGFWRCVWIKPGHGSHHGHCGYAGDETIWICGFPVCRLGGLRGEVLE